MKCARHAVVRHVKNAECRLKMAFAADVKRKVQNAHARKENKNKNPNIAYLF
jgi:hypothetical protein